MSAVPPQQLAAALSCVALGISYSLVNFAVPDTSWEKLLPSSFSSKGGDLLEVFAPMVRSAQARLSPTPLCYITKASTQRMALSWGSLLVDLCNALLVHPEEGRKQKCVITED